MKKGLLLGIVLFSLLMTQAQKKMFVVYPAIFEEIVNDYISKKSKQNIVCFSIIIDSGLTANAIKEKIDQSLQNFEADYLLLIGSSSLIPTFLVEGAAADALFACDSLSDFPKMAVGRFCVRDSNELKTIMDRALRNTKTSKKIVTIGSQETSELTLKKDFERLRDISSFLTEQNYELVAELFDGNQGEIDQAGNPTVNDVINAWKKTPSMVFYAGHGHYNGWQSSNFSDINISQLDSGVLPIIFSAACLNGNFAQQICFAQQWTVNQQNGSPCGAKAVFMSSALSDWDANLESIVHLCQDIRDSATLGDLWLKAYHYCFDSLLRKKEAASFLLFGDPSCYINRQELKINKDTLTESFSIYPNPSNDVLYINGTNFQSIAIYNVSGQIVLKTTEQSNKIDISSLKEGLYFIKIDQQWLKLVVH